MAIEKSLLAQNTTNLIHKLAGVERTPKVMSLLSDIEEVIYTMTNKNLSKLNGLLDSLNKEKTDKGSLVQAISKKLDEIEKAHPLDQNFIKEFQEKVEAQRKIEGNST